MVHNLTTTPYYITRVCAQYKYERFFGKVLLFYDFFVRFGKRKTASGRRNIYEGTEKVLKGRNNVAQGATDDKPRAEGKLAFTMPRCEGGKAMKWINPVC